MTGSLIRAAGVLLWRPAADGVLPEVALVHRPKYDDWSLPKGKLEPGESAPLAAVRETWEETGQRVALQRPLPTQHYTARGRPKEVVYWSGRALGGDFHPHEEIDALEWLPPDAAAQRLTYPRDADLIRSWLTGPATTTPILVVRNADAVKRTTWQGPDALRPLSDLGQAQATALSPLFAAYGVAQVWSSEARRCLDTVQPFASAAGLTIEVEPTLASDGHTPGSTGATALAQRTAALRHAPAATVVCAERAVLPDLVGHLGVLEPPALRVGDVLVVHVAAGGPVALEHHPAPAAQRSPSVHLA